MKLITITTVLAVSCVQQAYARGSDYEKPKRYPARCLTEEIENSSESGINKDDCLRRQQKCNMKTGTVEARVTACKQLNELYPEIAKEAHVNQEKLSLHNEKISLRESVKAEKKQIREEKKENRLTKKSTNHKFMKRCADWKPNTDNGTGNEEKFETCNELIRLTQDIKKFCILTAQTIDPTFEYDKLRKKRSVAALEDDEIEDNLEEVLEEVEEIIEEDSGEEVDEADEITDEPTGDNKPVESKTARKIPKMHSFHIKKESGKSTHEPKQTTQRKNAKKHLQSCESKRFLEWFEDHKDDDDVWFGQIDQILKDAQEAKDDELSRR